MTNHETERNNKGLCACCGRQPVSIDSDGVALRFCIACRVRIAPKMETRLDMDARLQLLEALQDNLRSRLLNATQPKHMLEHADAIERQAMLMLEKADAIRIGVEVDAASVAEIKAQLEDCKLEHIVLKACIQRGWKVTRIRKMIERLKRVEQKENGNADV